MIVDCYEIVGDRTLTLNYDGTRDYTRCFHVETNDPANDGMLTVATAACIPRLGSLYVFGPELDLATCRSITPRPLEDDSCLWRVNCGYKYDPKEGAQPPPEEGPPNPFLRPTIWSYQTDPREKVFDRDLDDLPVQNSAGQKFESPVLLPNNNWKATATKNVPYIDGSFLTAWANGVNDSAFRGVPAKRLWISSIVAPQVEDQYWGPYHQLTVEFSYNSERDWEPVKIADVGRYELQSGKLLPIKDQWNQNVSDPVNLNGSGLKGDPLSTVYRSFRGFRLLNFGGLGL